MPSIGFITIIAKNYLANARVLMRSVAEHYPEAPRLVVLVDRAGDDFDGSAEEFTIIESKDLGILNSNWFHFRYDTLELSTAVKPYAMRHALAALGVASVIYFDPDIRLYSPLLPVTDALESSNIVITPHLTERGLCDQDPIERQLLRTGAYNLGFVAVRSGAVGDSFLSWWCEKLAEQCLVDLPAGLFVDQKWVDLVPGLFDGVQILRDPGLNVAWWNLRTRSLELSAAGYMVNGAPLSFFHFSGFDPSTPGVVSKHQDQLDVGSLGSVSTLLSDYADCLMTSGYLQCRSWAPAYSMFADGTPIPDVVRDVLVRHPELAHSVEDPFSESGAAAIYERWNRPATGPNGGRELTRLSHRIYQLEPEIQVSMPDVFGAHWAQFVRWYIDVAAPRYRLGPRLLEPLRRELEGRQNSAPGASGAAVRLTPVALHIYESRKDLQAAFSDVWGQDALNFLCWLLTHGCREYTFDDENRAALEMEWQRLLARLDSPFGVWAYRMRRGVHSVLAASARAWGLSRCVLRSPKWDD